MTSSDTSLAPTPVSVAAVRSRRWPGLLLAATLGGLATWMGFLVPVVGGPVIGIVLGVLTREVLVRRSVSLDLGAGARFASKQVLQAAVVLLGLGLSLTQVVRTGRSALPVMLGTLAVGLVGAALVGRRLGLDRETRTLVGVGTAICGASAIATTSAVIGASEVAIATSVTTIFLFNALAAVLFPVQQWLCRKLHVKSGLAAGILTAAVIVLLLGPLAALLAVVVRDGADGIKFITETLHGPRLMELVDRLPGNARDHCAIAVFFCHVERGEQAIAKVDKVRKQALGFSLAQAIQIDTLNAGACD